MAQNLYREWFVKFRYPSHEKVKMVDSPLGKIPEGWTKPPFATLANFINGFAFKPHHHSKFGLPIVKIPELKNGVLPKTPRNDGKQIPHKYHLKNGDLLFSWSGSLEVNFWYDEPALLNQHLFKVIPISQPNAAFLLVALREALADFHSQTIGATMKHIRRSALDETFTIIPTQELCIKYNEISDNIYKQVINLNNKNKNISNTRNFLLLKLISGELDVSELDIEIRDEVA